MKKMKVLLISGMLAAGICMLAACGTGNQNNAVPDTNGVENNTTNNGNGTNNNGTNNGNTNNGNVGQDVENVGDDIVNGVEDAGGAVVDGVEDIVDGTENTTNDHRWKHQRHHGQRTLERDFTYDKRNVFQNDSAISGSLGTG